MDKCDYCLKPIPPGTTGICFECFGQMDQEEKLAKFRLQSRPVNPVSHYSRWSGHKCTHCWPADCGCFL